MIPHSARTGSHGWSLRHAPSIPNQGALMTPSGLVGEMLSGFILDTNGAGRFDLLIYPDGVLAVRGGYGDTVALSAQGAFAGAGILSSSPPAVPARISRLLPLSRADALAGDARNFFIPRATLLGVELKKRWYGHSLLLK